MLQEFQPITSTVKQLTIYALDSAHEKSTVQTELQLLCRGKPCRAEPFKPQYQHSYSPHCSSYTSYGTSWENWILKTSKRFIFVDHFPYSHDQHV